MIEVYVSSGKQLPDQIFVGWCWEVLLDLKLHHLAQRPGNVSTLRNNAINDAEIPNLSRDAVTLSPLMAVQQRQPIACYVAVMLTDIGHSTTGVLNQGLDWVAALVENYLYIPALEVLEFVTPLFFSNNQATYLLQQDQFHYILNGLLQADATYLRMVKNILAFEFPGKTLKASKPVHGVSKQVELSFTSCSSSLFSQYLSHLDIGCVSGDTRSWIVERALI